MNLLSYGSYIIIRLKYAINMLETIVNNFSEKNKSRVDFKKETKW